MNLSPEVLAAVDRMIRVRRDIHRHPELGFQERRTAALVAARLRELGLSPREGVAGTGVTALVEGGAGEGPTLLARADMDALPVAEETGAPYASEVPGVMHACGHDGHTAILLGLAELLAARRSGLKGRVKLVFQPAEEGPGGAEPMIKAGVMDSPKVDAAVALHLAGDEEVGTAAVAAGPVTAAVDEFTVDITSPGGHGALPQQAGDPVVAAAQVVLALQTLVSRERDPLMPAVLTVGSIHGGAAKNVIPDRVALGGTVRTCDPRLRAAFPERIRRVASGVAQALRCGCEFSYANSYPPIIVDERLARVIREEASAVLGEAAVVERRGMWSEDFSYFGEKAPACFFYVGAGNKAKGIGAAHHSPRFDIDEQALAVGLEILWRFLQRELGLRVAAEP